MELQDNYYDDCCPGIGYTHGHARILIGYVLNNGGEQPLTCMQLNMKPKGNTVCMKENLINSLHGFTPKELRISYLLIIDCKYTCTATSGWHTQF